MKDQLSQDQIAIVFAMYIGQRMQSWDGLPFILRGVSVTPYGTIHLHAVAKFDSGYTKEKLLLKPLPSISDEDAIEVINLIEPSTRNHAPNMTHLIAYLRGRIIEDCRKDYRIYQYLIQKGYAVPLFFGVDHPLNGKTAIEAGLAIDATTHP